MDSKHTNPTDFKQWVIENANINKIPQNVAEIQYYFYFVINLIKDVLQTEDLPLNDNNLKSKTIVINGSKLKKKQTINDFKFICVYLQKKLLENDLLSFYENQKDRNIELINFVCQYVSVLDDQPQSISFVFIAANSNKNSTSSGSGGSGGISKNNQLDQAIMADKELTSLANDLLAGGDFVAKMGKGVLGSLTSAAATIGKNISGTSSKALSSAKSVLNTVLNDKSGKLSNKITNKPEFRRSGTNDKKEFKVTNEDLNKFKVADKYANTAWKITKDLGDAFDNKTQNSPKPLTVSSSTNSILTEDQKKQIQARAEIRKQNQEKRRKKLIENGIIPSFEKTNHTDYKRLVELTKKYGYERVAGMVKIVHEAGFVKSNITNDNIPDKAQNR